MGLALAGRSGRGKQQAQSWGSDRVSASRTIRAWSPPRGGGGVSPIPDPNSGGVSKRSEGGGGGLKSLFGFGEYFRIPRFMWSVLKRHKPWEKTPFTIHHPPHHHQLDCSAAFATTALAARCLVHVPPLARMLFLVGVGWRLWSAGGATPLPHELDRYLRQTDRPVPNS